MIDVFRPLFEVTRDPSSHPKLHVFLHRVIGFDTVDDESKTERRYHKKFPYPKQWDYPQSPPYSYWFVVNTSVHVMLLTQAFRVYYMFANMASLNKWRRVRGFSDLFAIHDVSFIDLDLQTPSSSVRIPEKLATRTISRPLS